MPPYYRGVVLALAIVLIAPAAANAQAADSVRQIVADMQTSGYLGGFAQARAAIAQCQTPDPDRVWQLEVQANQFAQRAAELANASAGLDHAQALRLEQQLELQYDTLANPAAPEICYQPG
jgi:hypothetical protein